METDTTQRRPWWRRKLVLVWLLVLTSSVFLVGIPSWKREKQRREYFDAVERLQSEDVRLSSSQSDIDYNKRYLRKSELLLAEYGIEPFPNWNQNNWLSVNNQDLTGPLFQDIGKIVTLRYIEIANSNLTDDDLSFFDTIAHPTDIGLMNTKIKGSGLGHLCKADPIASIDLSGNHLDWAAVLDATKEKRLRAQAVFLRRTKLDANAFQFLATIEGMTELCLDNCKFDTSLFLNPSKTFRHLKWISLDGTIIDSQIGSALAQMRNLQSVSLRKAQLKPGALSPLLGASSVAFVNLSEASASRDDMISFLAQNLNLLDVTIHGLGLTEEDIDAAMKKRGSHPIHLSTKELKMRVRDMEDWFADSYWNTERMDRLVVKHKGVLKMD